ncbi:MAG: sigma-54-dependent Fis family transcriptional regulator [Gammaproteobacteria bacterium]|nr:sigma-54-dependent Fis family transcriptional regulator [Gammaproteobacteria bacterium]
MEDSISILLLDTEVIQSVALRDHLGKDNRPLAFGIVDDNKISDAFNLFDLCDDFTTWPCHEQELVCRLERLSNSEKLENCASPQPDLEYAEFTGLNLLGKSPRFAQALNLIKKMARCDAAVLIEGETGTGKEVTARAIHYLSARRDHPFVPVNCGAIPDNLLENELFGHEKGAYTDAKYAQVGLIAEANGGTLFLDEIDSLSPKAQVTLLRFLQDQQYRSLGAKRYSQADVRIMAATNANLRKNVDAGLFREDLYFRINILSMTLPPLRERFGDIAILAEKFVANCRECYKQGDKYLHKNALQWLESYSWPGNVRELENTIHRMFLLSDAQAITHCNSNTEGQERRSSLTDRRMSKLFNMSFNDAKSHTIHEFEKAFLNWIINQTHGNVSMAAKIAGKERRALGKLLKKYNITYSRQNY